MAQPPDSPNSNTPSHQPHGQGLHSLAATGLILLAVLAIPTGYYFFLSWSKSRNIPILTADAEFNTDSVDYWHDRTAETILRAQRLEGTESRRLQAINQSLFFLMSRAKRIPNVYHRSRALSDIALTQLAYDVNLTVGDILDLIEGSTEISAMKARIYASVALFSARQGKVRPAMLAVRDYERTVLDNGLRLDNEDGIIAFLGIVRVLHHFHEHDRFVEVVEKLEAHNEQIPDRRLRGLAARFIAWQQFRAGMPAEALQTASRIFLPLEQARAYQLMIAETARPSPPSLEEPVLKPLPSQGPWPPLTDVEATRRIVGTVLGQIAKNPDAQMQAEILQALAGSRLMCDTRVFPIFRDALRHSARFEEEVKRPAMSLLDEPQSALIRASQGLPPLPVQPHVVDTAADDWGVENEFPLAAVEPISAETVRGVAEQRLVRTSLSMAQALMTFGNRRDARATLRNAAAAAGNQGNLFNRLSNLRSIGSLQLTAGDPEAARQTLEEARNTYVEYTRDPSGFPYTITTALPTEIAMAQIRGRFLDNALDTIRTIPGSSSKTDLLVLLTRERWRSEERDAARATVALMPVGPQKQEWEQRLQQPPERSVESDSGGSAFTPVQTAERLIRAEELDAALAAIARITNRDEADRLRLRIVRACVTIARPYVLDDALGQRVRRRMLDKGTLVARSIEGPLVAAQAFEALASGFVFDRSLPILEPAALAEQALARVTADPRLTADPYREAELSLNLATVRLQYTLPDEGGAEPWPAPQADRRSAVEEVHRQAEAVLKHLSPDSPAAFRTEISLEAARLFGRTGDPRRARELVEYALAGARQLKDPQQAVGALVRLGEIRARLGDSQEAGAIFFEAATLCENINSGTELAPQQWAVLGRRLRESAVESIVRTQLLYGLYEDTMRLLPQIEEEIVRNRLYRMLVYQHLYDHQYEQAEIVARRILDVPMRNECLQDLTFLKSGREGGSP